MGGLLISDLSIDGRPDPSALKRIKKLFEAGIFREGVPCLAGTIDALSNWYGIQPNQADDIAARKVPIFWEIFVSVRAYAGDNADFMDIEDMGAIAENFVTLARKMLTSDTKVYDGISSKCARELRP